jgi:16S rRNA processing protein RimM
MIKRDKCTLLGKLIKPHGIKGSVLLRFAGLKAEDIKERGQVFVEIDGLLVPFFIENFQEKSADTAILNLTGINTESKAKDFTGYLVYVGQDQVRTRRNKPGLPGIRDYKVIDKKLGYIGLAVEIVDSQNNPLLYVQNNGKEYLVPVHDDIILEVNSRDKTIRIDAPEGLFEL